MSISIVLADDHAVVLLGMQALLESEPGLSVIGAASDGDGAVHLAEHLKPDVLVLDLVMPGRSGIEVLRIVRERAPDTKTVVFSMFHSSSSVMQALQNGAIGYVLKGSPKQQLVQAVREAAAGRQFLCPPVTEIALRSYLERSKSGPAEPHQRLTLRQLEVLRLAAEGNTNGEIAALLKISPRTAEHHRAQIMDRLGLRNQTELVRHAMRHGMIPPAVG